MKYPKYRLGKSVAVKMTPQSGIMKCDYKHILRAFGQPTFSTESGDDFDGVEKVAWHIQFETGQVAKISDVRPFGTHDIDHKTVKEWRVNSHNTDVFEWIKQIIRDANPKY